MKLTWFDANTWLIEAGNKRILIDPWLVGDLVFGNMPWLVRGSRPQAATIPQNIDLILLSQGLADHAHLPTLQQLDKSIPVLASPDGAKVAKGIGYQSVTVLNHGDTLCLDGEMSENPDVCGGGCWRDEAGKCLRADFFGRRHPAVLRTARLP